MKILYIDDDPDDQEMFLEAIETIDPKIECTVCQRASDALQVLPSRVFDFIFIDYRIPNSGARMVLEAIRLNRKLEKTRIIMYSAYMTDVEKTDCRNLGAHEFISKPEDFRTLRSTLEGVIRRGL